MKDIFGRERQIGERYRRTLENHLTDPSNLPDWFSDLFSTAGNGSTQYIAPDTAGNDGTIKMVTDNEVRGINSNVMPDKSHIKTVEFTARVLSVGQNSPDYAALGVMGTKGNTKESGAELRLYDDSQSVLALFSSTGTETTITLNHISGNANFSLKIFKSNSKIILKEGDSIIYKNTGLVFDIPTNWYSKVLADTTSSGGSETNYISYVKMDYGVR